MEQKYRDRYLTEKAWNYAPNVWTDASDTSWSLAKLKFAVNGITLRQIKH